MSGRGRFDVPFFVYEKVLKSKAEGKGVKETMGIKIPNYDPSAFSLWRELLEWVESITFAGVVAFFLFTFVMRLVTVEGHSMEPTLEEHDRLIIQTLNYEPELGDIIIIKLPDARPLVKRVIAVEGQTIDIDFENGIVYRDGEVLDEPYIMEPTYRSKDMIFPATVPEGCLFVMGDNRNHSTDSRDMTVGMVPVERVVGKAVFRFMPFDSFGGLYDNLLAEESLPAA